jgi:hypothetical protein
VQARNATGWVQADNGRKGLSRTLGTWQSRQRAITTAAAAAAGQGDTTTYLSKRNRAADAGSSRLNPTNIDIVDRRLSGRKAAVCLSKSNSDVKPLW